MTTEPNPARDPAQHPAVQAMRAVEGFAPLDQLDHLLSPVADRLVADPRVRSMLQGRWLGHALHPLLTDMPLGLWTSATVLDLIGGRGSRPAAQRLIGLGLAAAVPTAATGLTEWSAIRSRPERRTGALHAAVNSAALVCYAASWRARRRHHHAAGALLALAGGGTAAIGGYLGAHLTEVRKVSTYHPGFNAE